MNLELCATLPNPGTGFTTYFGQYASRDVQGEIFQYLDLEALKNLRSTCKSFKENIDSKSISLKLQFKPRNTSEKIESFFLQWENRPLWQKGGLIITSIFTAPFVGIYHSPKLISKGWRLLKPKSGKVLRHLLITAANLELKARKNSRKTSRFIQAKVIKPIYEKCSIVKVFTHDKMWMPVVNFTKKIAKAVFINLPKKINQGIIKPVCFKAVDISKTIYKECILPSAKFTYTKVLTPVGQGIQKAARAAFITLPKKSYEYILKPTGNRIKKLAILTNTHILTPLANKVVYISKQFFIEFPKFVFKTVIKPRKEKIQVWVRWSFDTVIFPLMKLAYNDVLTPLAKAVKFLVKGIFTTLKYILKKTGSGLWKGIRLLNRFVLTPFCKIIYQIGKGLLVTLPVKIYRHVLKRLGQKFVNTVIILNDYVLTPLLKIIYQIGKGLLVTLPKKIYKHVLNPIGTTISFTSRQIYKYVLTPVGQTIATISKLIFVQATSFGVLVGKVTVNTVIKPGVALVSTVASFVFIKGPDILKVTVITPSISVLTETSRVVAGMFSALASHFA